MQALVTGGAGFVGSHIADALVARGDSVTVLDNLDPRVHGNDPPSLPRKIDFVQGDISSPAALDKALAKPPTVVFHEAAMVGLGKGGADAEAYATTNLIGTVRLIDAINRLQIRPRFILASTMALYGEGGYECEMCHSPREGQRKLEDLKKGLWEPYCDKCGSRLQPIPVNETQPSRPDSVYAITKLCQEQLCMSLGKQYDVPVIALRYHNIYGPRMPRDTPYAGVASIFKSQLLARKSPIVFEDGRQLRDFVHVYDIVQANLLAADGPLEEFAYQSFNVGTGTPHHILDFAKRLAEVLAPQIEPEFPGKFRFGDVRHVFASISKIRRLGFSPNVSFEEGVAEFAREPIRSSPMVTL